MWVIGIEIRVIYGAGFVMMGVMSFAHIAPVKPRIDEHYSFADSCIRFFIPRYKRAMHGIMRYNKHTRIEPALQRNETYCLPERGTE